jgi:hypothetical protein
MNTHPSIHLDIARERQQGLIAQAERHCLIETPQRAATLRLRLFGRMRLFGRSGEPSRTAREADAWERPTMRPDQMSSTTFRELAHRVDGGIDVRLLWSARENRLAVTVFDAGQLLVLDAEQDEALHVFYHPYAHAASQAAA